MVRTGLLRIEFLQLAFDLAPHEGESFPQPSDETPVLALVTIMGIQRTAQSDS
jgi:hypothetical protein